MIVGNSAANHAERLRRMAGGSVVVGVSATLLETGEIIKEDTVRSIDEGAIFGPGHIPSAPGQPPNSDTRDLALSGRVTEIVEVADYVQTAVQFGGPTADYAAVQEMGGGNVAERPYLRPASERARKDHVNRVKKAVAKNILGK